MTATCLVQANAFYGYRPTLAAVFGVPAADQADLPPALPLITAQPRRSLSASWHAPPGMPRPGSISHVPLPGLRSRFPARSAWLYLPPAYLASPRDRLPVLVLVAGQPGGPEDWILAGQLPAVMDRFAAAHDGLAPLVIVPDLTGSALGNTLCLNSRLGAADTYLDRDVPAWAATILQIDSSGMAVGGPPSEVPARWRWPCATPRSTRPSSTSPGSHIPRSATAHAPSTRRSGGTRPPSTGSTR